METDYGVYLIIGICALIILLGLLKAKLSFIVNFVTRMVTCMALIYLINQLLISADYNIHVGLNLVSAITTGSLGISGIALLYGIMITKII